MNAFANERCYRNGKQERRVLNVSHDQAYSKFLDATRIRAALRGQPGGGGTDEDDQLKARLHELHLRKIDLADEVLILNVVGYIGESTARELAYARAEGKRVRYLERPDREKGWNDGR